MKNKVKIIQGDITKIAVDVIVNAANSSLLGGGGVDGAIHRAGGSQILDECKEIRGCQGSCKVGHAVITSAGDLPADYVIHAVGPNWSGGNNHEATLLERAYLSCFDLLAEYKLKSISLPNISTGIYKFPKALAADIALKTIRACLHNNPHIQQVNIVCFEQDNYEIYNELMSKMLASQPKT